MIKYTANDEKKHHGAFIPELDADVEIWYN